MPNTIRGVPLTFTKAFQVCTKNCLSFSVIPPKPKEPAVFLPVALELFPSHPCGSHFHIQKYIICFSGLPLFLLFSKLLGLRNYSYISVGCISFGGVSNIGRRCM